MSESTLLCQGVSLGPDRRRSGTLRTVSTDDQSEIEAGDIVYVLDPDTDENNVVFFYNLIKSGAAGFLCPNIGRTDHRIVLANELGVPCVSNIDHSIVEHVGSTVTIHGNSVHRGSVFEDDRLAPHPTALDFPDTDTPVKINLGFPEIVDRIPEIPDYVDGVGFMRLEFLLLDVLDEVHPHEYVKRHGIDDLATNLADRIEPVLTAFNDPVWIRTDDFSVPDLGSMVAGDGYESDEKNSMLGWRGISRSIEDPVLLDPQFRAIRKLLDRGHQNIGLFPPMTRFPREYCEWKQSAVNHGLEDVTFGLMVETPSAALTVERFVDDISFIVFGSNDLTQFTLAIDRSNERLREKFDETETAVLTLFEHVISVANNHGIKTYIGGQAGSDEDLIPRLSEFGITGFSVQPDLQTVSETRSLLTSIEAESS